MHLIEVAMECCRLGNWNSAMAIALGLNLTPVCRLTKTWSKVKSSKLALLKVKYLKILKIFVVFYKILLIFVELFFNFNEFSANFNESAKFTLSEQTCLFKLIFVYQKICNKV